MSKTVIYPEEITLPVSIIDMFNGTADFVITNRFFAKESMYDEHYHDIRQLKTADKGGFRLSTPIVLWRNPDTKAYDRFFVVAWCDARRQAKQYFIAKPNPKFFSEENLVRQNVKVSVIPNTKDEHIRRAEQVLCALDHQLAMGMQVLLIANLFDIDISKFPKDNVKFFERLGEEAAKSVEEKSLKVRQIVFDPAYIESFTKAPCYGKIDKITIPVAKPSDDDEELVPAFKTAIDTIRDSIQIMAIRRKTKNDLYRVLTDKKDIPVPAFMHNIYKNKEEQYVENCSPKLKFVIKYSDKTDKIKSITGVQRAKGVMPMTRKDLVNAWGGEDLSRKGARCEGVMFIKPELSYQYFAQGQPCTIWRVDRVSTRKVESSHIDYNDGAEYFDADDEADTSTSFKPTVPDTGDEENSDDGYDAP